MNSNRNLTDADRQMLDHTLITDVLFYPRRIDKSQVPDHDCGEKVMIDAGDVELGAYWFKPVENVPTVLLFHGNGEIMTDYLYDFHDHIAALGYNFMVADYRGYGLSTGSPSLSTLLDDVHAVWEYLTEKRGTAPEDIIVMGRSLGSLAALELASGPARDARALVIESGIGSFAGWIDRMAPMLEGLQVDVEALKSALKKGFDHEEKIKRYNGKVLVMHAPQDEIVPVGQGKQLARWGGEERTRLHIFPRGGHNDIMFLNGEEYFRVLGEFLESASS